MSKPIWVKITSYQHLLEVLEKHNQIDGVVMLGFGGRSSKTFFRYELDGEIVLEMFNYIDDTEEPLTEERVAEYINAGALFLDESTGETYEQ